MGGKISIIVPVYNTGEYLDGCVQSVLSQDYGNWEMLLIDDGSDEKTACACVAAAEKNDRIFSFRKQNGGQLSARTEGIGRATGDYLMFLDSDDTLAPGALGTVARTMDETGTDILFFGFERRRGDRTVYSSADVADAPLILTDRREIYRKLYLDPSYNAMWRKACARRVFTGKDYSGWYRLRVAEDLLQSMDLYENARSVGFIGDRLYRYALNGGSVTHTVKYSNVSDDLTVYCKLAGYLESGNVFGKSDIADFYRCAAGKLSRHAEKIAVADIGKKEKREMLARLRSDEFARRTEAAGADAEGTHQRIMYRLFTHRRYGMLILYCKTVGKLRRIAGK